MLDRQRMLARYNRPARESAGKGIQRNAEKPCSLGFNVQSIKYTNKL